MFRSSLILVILLAPLFSTGQVVDGIKSSSDRYEAARSEEYSNPTTTYFSNTPTNPSAPVSDYPNSSSGNLGSDIPFYGIDDQFGASNSNIILPVEISDPEDSYKSRECGYQAKGASQPESDWALYSDQIRDLEKEEFTAYLLEESKRGRHRRFFAEFRAQSAVRTEYGILLPRAQSGYGVFSTDLRMNQIIEVGNSFVSTYRTWDWQVLKARIIDWKHCSFSLGGGMVFEQYNNNIFGEATAEFAFNFFKGRLYIPLEGRMAINEGIVIRTEMSAIGNWLIHGGAHNSIFFSAGYAQQNYFQEVRTNGIVLGIHCKFF